MKGPVENKNLRNQQLGDGLDGIKPGSGGMVTTNDFGEYVWMHNELEQFDKQMEQELAQSYEDEFWEEYYIDMCFEEMLDDEEENETEWYFETLDDLEDCVNMMEGVQIETEKQESEVETSIHYDSNLNPLAPEFVPTVMAYSSDSDSDDESR